MNHTERRHPTKEIKPARTSTPHYQVVIDIHLPADPPWRKEYRNLKLTAIADKPEDMWRQVVVSMTEMLGFPRAPNFICGLILDVVNHLPDDVRAAIAHGIIDGNGLTLVTDGKTVEASLDRKFDSLTLGGEKRTPSGIIIPEVGSVNPRP